MPPKGSSKELASAKAAAREAAKEAQRVVRDAYAVFRSKAHDPAAAARSIDALQELVLQGGPGGAAACVALVKACTLQATAALLQRSPDEARAGLLLTQAAEAAVRGALVYKSAQMMFAAEGLLVACAGMPEGKERREAARDMLQHGRTTWALTDGGSVLLPQRQDVAVRSGEEWWRRMEPLEWAQPAGERVPGSDKFPWECGDSASDWQNFMAAMHIQTADRMQRASIRDSMHLIRDVLTKVPVTPEPGSKEELQHRRNLKHADKADRAFAKEPLAVRLVQEKHLLPPEVHSRLRRACGLPADELTALRQQPGIGQQLHELQQLKTVGMGSTRAKVLEQRANKDAAKARQDAARRAQVIHEYLRGVLAAQPPPAEASDKAALMCALRLAETTRTELPVLAAVLRELWQAKQLREDELLELEELLRHTQQLCPVDPLGAVRASRTTVIYRLPPLELDREGRPLGKHRYLASADELEAELLTRVLHTDVASMRKALAEALPVLSAALVHLERARQRFNDSGLPAARALPLATPGAAEPQPVDQPAEQGPAQLEELPMLSRLRVPHVPAEVLTLYSPNVVQEIEQLLPKLPADGQGEGPTTNGGVHGSSSSSSGDSDDGGSRYKDAASDAASAQAAQEGGSESDLEELDLVDKGAIAAAGSAAGDEQRGSEAGDAPQADEEPPALVEPPARDDPLVQLLMRQQEARLMLDGVPVGAVRAQLDIDVPDTYLQSPLQEAAFIRVDDLLRPALLGLIAATNAHVVNSSPPGSANYTFAFERLEMWYQEKLLDALVVAAHPGVSEERAHEVIAAAVEAVKADPDFQLNPDGALDGRAAASVLALFADLHRELLAVKPLDLQEALAEAAAQGPEALEATQEECEAVLMQYHTVLLQVIFHGLSLLSSRQRLTRLQEEALLQFMFQHVTAEEVIERIRQDGEACTDLCHQLHHAFVTSLQPEQMALLATGNNDQVVSVFRSSDEGLAVLQALESTKAAQQKAELLKDHAWAACLLHLPTNALERVHAWTCLQVGHSFSDKWELSNRMQELHMYASRDIPLGMLVPTGAENGQQEGQAQWEQQRQLERQLEGQQEAQQGLRQEQHGSGSEAGASAPDERQRSAAAPAALQVSATRLMNDMVESKLPENAGIDVVARWFALWAVNAKHGAEALSSAPAPSGGKPDKRGGSSVAAAGPPPITAADVELLPDAQAERILSEGEPMMTALRLAAGLVQLSEEVSHVLAGVQAALPATREAWDEAIRTVQERAADCAPADLAALGRQAVGLLRCMGECLQLVQAMHKCLEEVKEGNHAKTLDAKARQTQEQEQERWWAPTKAASLEEWAREANEHAAGQLADAAAELEDALAAGSQDAELFKMLVEDCRLPLAGVLRKLQTAGDRLAEGVGQLRAAQEACYLGMRYNMRQLFRSYAMTVPLDNLARGLLAHALPHLWQKQLASQEEAARRSNLESLLEELEADEARQAAAAAAAAARRQKKKERKKGKGGAAQQDAPADAAAEAARGAEQEPQQAQQAEAGEDGSGSGEEAVAADAAAAAQPAADAEPAGVQQPQQEAQTQQPAGPQESSGSEGPGAEEAGSEDGHQAEAEADDQHSLEALIAASARFDWSKVQGADDEQAPGRGALQAADEWRGTAPNSSRQRPTAAAGPAGKQQQGAGTSPRAQQQQQQQPPPPQRAHSAQAKRDESLVRVVSWMGDYICACGTRQRCRDDCPECGQLSPCRDYLRGKCKKPSCRFPHPPFDLPPLRPAASDRLVNLTPTSVTWRPDMPTAPAGARPVRPKAPAAAAGRLSPPPPPTPAAASLDLAAPGMAAAVQALARQLGVGSMAELQALLGPDELQDALEQVQVQLVEEESIREQQHGAPPAAQQQQLGWEAGSRWQAGGDVRRPASRGGQQGGESKATFLEGGPRILGSSGAWVCTCGRRNRGGTTSCTVPRCKEELCKAWRQGPCRTSACKALHPPFDPAGDWSAAAGSKAVLWPGAPLYKAASAQPSQQPSPQPLQQPSPPPAAQPAPLPTPQLPPAVPPPLTTPAIEPQAPAVAPPAAQVIERGWDPFNSPAIPVAAAVAGDLLPHGHLGLPGLMLGAAHMLPQPTLTQPQLPQQPIAPQPLAPAAAAPAPTDDSDLSDLLEQLGIGGLSGGLDAAGSQGGHQEYNCFLNAIIQCLWRCTFFRQQLAAWGPAVCGFDLVVSALYSLFAACAAEEQQLQQAGPLQSTAARRGLVNPSELRQALSALPGPQQYRVGEMNDAGEVLLTIYERVMGVSPEGELLNTLFGLPLSEHVQCHSCGLTTRQSSYMQYFHSTQAATLSSRHSFSPDLSMGNLLKLIDQQTMKMCDKAVGGCGMKNSVVHTLNSLPLVFTLQLGWNSHHEQPHIIAATLAAVDDTLDLAEVYSGVRRSMRHYVLRSMFCCSGNQYSAFVRTTDLGAWLLVDSASVSRVGAWHDVLQQCEAGRWQPSMLFYEAV